jgi:hypothetical protein
MRDAARVEVHQYDTSAFGSGRYWGLSLHHSRRLVRSQESWNREIKTVIVKPSNVVTTP